MLYQRLLVLLLAALSISLVSESQAQDPSRPYEAAVIEEVKAYVDAFNKRDAKAVSELWASNGELVGADGKSITGRENIRKALVERFKELPADAELSVTINRITFVTRDVAAEEGVAEFDGEETEYRAIHKKENGSWRLHSIRESSIAPEPEKKSALADLEWLVGEWVDQSDDAVVRTSVRWSKNNNFLVSNFRVEIPDSEPLEGTQVIRFDSVRETIRSWSFDSNGGISEGVWSRKKNRWHIRVKKTLPDGSTAKSTNVFKVKDKNEFSWASSNRTMNGESLPDVGPVNVIRLKEATDQ